MNHGTCIYFNGLRLVGDDYRKHCCLAGVNYFSTFDGSKSGIMLRMPCVDHREKSADGKPGTCFKPGQNTILVPVDRRGEVAIPCSLRVEPTDDQVQQDRIESERYLANFRVALSVVSTWRVKPKPDLDRFEIIECPVCQGKLHLSQASYNGHTSGKCETAGCVEFME